MKTPLHLNIKKLVKLWLFILSFFASKSVFAFVGSITKGLTIFFTPAIAKLSTYFANNFPNLGYWLLAFLLTGASLLFLLTEKDEPLLKSIVIDKTVGVILISIAILVFLQPYIGFSIL